MIPPLLLAQLDFLSGNRFVFSMFSLLTAVLLAYFWGISKDKAKANNKDITGLVYLFMAFLLHFLLGLLSIFQPLEDASHVPNSYLVLSGLISLCFLSSLPFFSIGRHQVDEIVSITGWKTGIKYFAFGWVIILSMGQGGQYMQWGDLLIAILCYGAFGYFISRYFWQRGLRFLGALSAFFFVTYLSVQVFQPSALGDGKFIDMNSYLLGPASVMSVIILSYTFNWINELNFYELSKIWVSEGEVIDSPAAQQSYNQLTSNKNQATWMDKIADDKIEKVIEEMIILKKHKNESLEDILNLAARNTRNNNSQMKQIIKYEDYQLSRNQVSNALIQLVQQG